ncbi:Uncharacterised protein [Salmonella enterica subsp. diarizonae]|nr:Uncharacterised protein [Salmonella enterica subsp. diarizonae]SUG59747.1 Uncharacterised protein [Salmonella enterica subsp. arizonae]
MKADCLQQYHLLIQQPFAFTQTGYQTDSLAPLQKQQVRQSLTFILILRKTIA